MKPLQAIIFIGMLIGSILIVGGSLAIATGATRAPGGGLSGNDAIAAIATAIGILAYIVFSTIGALAYLYSGDK